LDIRFASTGSWEDRLQIHHDLVVLAKVFGVAFAVGLDVLAVSIGVGVACLAAGASIRLGVALTMSDLLEIEGFSVLTARNGLDALNKMKAADHISLVLLDLWMPLMDGREVLRRKRSDPA
jgi:hypothetical protein